MIYPAPLLLGAFKIDRKPNDHSRVHTQAKGFLPVVDGGKGSLLLLC